MNNVLHNLIVSGTFTALEAAISLLSSGTADPLQSDASGTSPLTLALACDNLAMSQVLLAFGADLHEADETGVVPANVAQGSAKAFIEKLMRTSPCVRKLMLDAIESCFVKSCAAEYIDIDTSRWGTANKTRRSQSTSSTNRRPLRFDISFEELSTLKPECWRLVAQDFSRSKTNVADLSSSSLQSTLPPQADDDDVNCGPATSKGREELLGPDPEIGNLERQLVEEIACETPRRLFKKRRSSTPIKTEEDVQIEDILIAESATGNQQSDEDGDVIFIAEKIITPKSAKTAQMSKLETPKTGLEQLKAARRSREEVVGPSPGSLAVFRKKTRLVRTTPKKPHGSNESVPRELLKTSEMCLRIGAIDSTFEPQIRRCKSRLFSSDQNANKIDEPWKRMQTPKKESEDEIGIDELNHSMAAMSPFVEKKSKIGIIEEENMDDEGFDRARRVKDRLVKLVSPDADLLLITAAKQEATGEDRKPEEKVDVVDIDAQGWEEDVGVMRTPRRSSKTPRRFSFDSLALSSLNDDSKVEKENVERKKTSWRCFEDESDAELFSVRNVIDIPKTKPQMMLKKTQRKGRGFREGKMATTKMNKQRKTNQTNEKKKRERKCKTAKHLDDDDENSGPDDPQEGETLAENGAEKESDEIERQTTKPTGLQTWLELAKLQADLPRLEAKKVEGQMQLEDSPIDCEDLLMDDDDACLPNSEDDDDDQRDPAKLPDAERRKLEFSELSHLWNLSNNELRKTLTTAGINAPYVNILTRTDYEKHLLYVMVHQKHKIVQNVSGRKYSKQLEHAIETLTASEGDATRKRTLHLPLGKQMDQKIRKVYETKGQDFFVYLLMDPRTLGANEKLITFETFVQSIFYVGKGRKLRPLAHMCETKNLRDQNSTLLLRNKKMMRINEIWMEGMGVVLLEIGQGKSSDEAYARETAIIEAIMLKNLTNIKEGTVSTVTRQFSKTQRAQFGTLILINAMKMLKMEGIRSIFPEMLEKLAAQEDAKFTKARSSTRGSKSKKSTKNAKDDVQKAEEDEQDNGSSDSDISKMELSLSEDPDAEAVKETTQNL